MRFYAQNSLLMMLKTWKKDTDYNKAFEAARFVDG